MKELSKIMELLRALQQENPEPGQSPLPNPGTLSESYTLDSQETEPAIQQHYTGLSLWAIGHYNGRIAPPEVQQLVYTILLGLTHTAPSGRLISEPPNFETLQQQLQAFIDGWLDSNTEK
ncbi:MAG: hypothetical protein H6556_17975 [Lewinellaceae bacterium]|nr:hypothetical protein [Lewinellaceae bacterium]